MKQIATAPAAQPPARRFPSKGLCHSYVDTYSGERVEALRDLHLSVNAGELLTVVRPSGCGKSTMLYIMRV